MSNERPVPLTEGVLDRSGVYQFLAPDGTVGRTSLLRSSDIRQRRDKPGSQDVIVPLVRHLLATPLERALVFRNTRGSAQGCAGYLAAELGLAPATTAIEALPPGDPSGSSSDLRKSLAGGTAFHTSDLSRDEREIVEAAFRDPHGGIHALVATSTVAAGVNTPASTVIIVEHEFRGETDVPYTVAEYKNMAGRAGRLGFKEQGRSILLAEGSHERETLFRRYVLGVPEAMRSSFEPAALDTWILRLLAQAPRIPEAEIPSLLAGTYGGYLAARRTPGWQQQIQTRIAELVKRMLSLDLLAQDGAHVQLTLLGKACGASTLSFESALRLVRALKESGAVTAESFLVLIQALPECDQVHTPLFKKGQKEKAWPQEVARRLGPAAARTLQRNAADEWAWCARAKRALVLLDWINGVSLETIEARYTMNMFQPVAAGNIRGFAESARLHLRPAFAIASVLLLDKAPSADAVESLLRQLEVGIPAECLPLLEARIELRRAEILTLRSLGVTNPEQLWQLPKEELIAVLGPRRAKAVEARRPMAAAR